MLNKAVLLSTLSAPEVKYFASFCIIPTYSNTDDGTLGYGDDYPNSVAYNFKGISSQDIVKISFTYTSPPMGGATMLVSNNLHQFIVNSTATPDRLSIRIVETGVKLTLGYLTTGAIKDANMYWQPIEVNLGRIIEGEEMTIELIPEATII